ncbi:MAG: GtrA family protein [Lachnospiraceae bacterium]
MIKKCKELLVKYREVIVYLIVGVLTTIFSWAVLFLGKLFLNVDISWQNFLNNTLSWAGGVLFAYPLNRKWVFKSTNPGIFKEFTGFAASRVSTWILDVIIMWLFVNVFTLKAPIKWACGIFGYFPEGETLGNLNYWIVKIFISSVLVTILNYVFSKLLIFKSPKKQA